MVHFKKGDFNTIPFLWRVEGENPITQTIYMWMCTYMDRDGKCFPSIETLSKKCGCGITSTKQYIQRLIDLKIIEKNPRYKEGIQTTSEYFILYPDGGRQTTSDGGRHATTELNPLSIYIASKEEISDLLLFDEINDNKIPLGLLFKMIELGYKIEKDKKILLENIQWFKDKSSIYGYRTMAGDIDWSRISIQVDKRYEYHKGKKDKIENYKTSLIKFLDNKPYQGKQKK